MAGDDQPTDRPEPARFAPPISPAGEPFWDASREQRFTLPWCPACEQPHWYPRGFCPSCLSEDIEWRDAEGEGTVHAVSVQPKPNHPGLADRAPYAVVLVDLVEGVRMMLQVVETSDPSAVAVGAPVRIGWEPLPDGRHLPTALVGR
jgi:uncharacterized OB-fold protein